MKKGFTLIELLAVIIILAIIALISSPIIIGLIDDTRKEAFKNTSYGIIKAGEIYYSQNLLNKTIEEVTFTYTDGVESSSVAEKELKYKGTRPQNGQIKVNSEGKIAIAIHNGMYCAIKGYDDSEVTLLEKEVGECIIPSYADTSGASTPELITGMIPVIHNGTNWVKADITKKWHDYNAQEWANVVLVTEATRNTYKDALPGATINETDVLAYLVWIPRYRYKLFNVTAASVSPQTIEIVFEDKNTTKSNGSTNGTWLTHPAFTFGTSELDGIWVGKFETTGNTTTPTVKPNILSINNQNLSIYFTTAQKFNNATTYGITSDFDSHMMKSMEWGAVAYLSYSQYGKNSEIFVNPSSSYITGRGGNTVSQSATTDASGSASSTLYSYDGKQCDTKTGYVCTGAPQSTYGMASSTTGNIYGIYDMSGGRYEFVMGAVYNSDNTTVNVAYSGFAQATIDSTDMSKYIDKYTYGTTRDDQTAYNRRQLGDATGETRGWCSDDAYLAYSSDPWLHRGGYMSGVSPTYAGIFAINSSSRLTNPGSASQYYTFRLVVSGS